MAVSYISIKNTDKADWQAATTKTYTSLNPVTVWRVQISTFLHQLNYFETLLSSQEKAKISRYQQENDRSQRIISKAVLRILLSRYIGINPAEISFQVDQNKKPCLENAFFKLNFNVSHSGNWVFIAIAAIPVGVDVERMDASFTWQNMLPLVLVWKKLILSKILRFHTKVFTSCGRVKKVCSRQPEKV